MSSSRLVKVLPNAFPPLAKSDYLNADVNRAIEIVLKGKTGEVVVNGKKYNSVMTAQTLTDDEVANVLTYVYSTWGNSKKEVTPAMVKKERAAGPAKTTGTPGH
jgi:nitrite reductase (NO-forming)